ncbi:hypothetical protein CMI42_00645 [Candidatus Pacearchaeota archaeon]|nr:hypothetical protein [Candidatus Pacearchaeota archaeon]|tara:strand:- start:316 stop:582 length:267 start_codon:yes stop_codon:yes gene_type:complete
MANTFIGVREVDEEIFHKFKAKTVEERMNLGYALTLAMKKWLTEEKNKNDSGEEKLNGVRQLLKIKPFSFGKNTSQLSNEIDDILYGE